MSFKGTEVDPKRFHRSQIKFYLILLPIVTIMVLPIIYIFSQALKPLDELVLFPPRFFVQKPTLRNFEVLKKIAGSTGVPLSRYLFNSLLVVITVVILTILITLMSGYALSKKRFKAKKMLFSINQSALMFVPIAVAIPSFLIVVNIGIYDTFLAHILPMLAMPVGLFLVKQFIDQVPDELISAALIDGANDFQIVTKIVAPIIKPAIATVGILTFQAAWGNAQTSIIYVTNESLKTFAFYMGTLGQVDSLAGQGIAAASALIMFIPGLIIFIVLQSKVMDTMSHSGVK